MRVATKTPDISVFRRHFSKTVYLFNHSQKYQGWCVVPVSVKDQTGYQACMIKPSGTESFIGIEFDTPEKAVSAGKKWVELHNGFYDELERIFALHRENAITNKEADMLKHVNRNWFDRQIQILKLNASLEC